MRIYIIGPSGSGKTTLSHKITKEHNAVRWSGDETKLRPKRLIPLVVESLKDNDTIVLDFLSTKLKLRQYILEELKDIECKKILVFMNTPLEECMRRNLLKDDPLPQFVIEDTHSSLEYPTLDEGWDEIIVINNDKDIENLKNEIKSLDLLGGDLNA